MQHLEPLHMSPVDRAGQVTGMNFALGSFKKFQTGFRDEKRSKILGTSSGAKFRNKANMAKHKILTFGPILTLVTLKAVSLQLNGMLMMWKIQEAKKTMPSGLPEFIPPFIPLTGMKCSYGKISRSREPSQPTLSYEHIKTFTKALEVRQDLGNRASPVNRAHVKRP